MVINGDEGGSGNERGGGDRHMMTIAVVTVIVMNEGDADMVMIVMKVVVVSMPRFL